ncbi:Leukotriene A-4 hydrolase [Psilocybe cubensis]|uniref:Peptidase M1 leukotriene A4 hydrolase/aminopeptidase C-terminal domain-containing protein n=2 Tax=Psilocybe cubensis TaxID=181762 RepID=A0A8H8CR53_PSICU|nr:Leukotriene A-4 hydrolase [Psilocybe cubensis]KAH9487215.1 Leukotriene A-4 hydrolase [Psilocybe cubensis]
MADITVDTATRSNITEIATEHVDFEWRVDFETQVISGSATHTMIVKKTGVTEAIFDTGDLSISAITINGQAAQYTLDPKDPVTGSALHVVLPGGLQEEAKVTIKVYYRTTQDCTALQWLDKDQTQGKKFPYLFSQCQPIYARSLAPLQDTPGNKIKYSAKVTAVLPVLLSAIRISPPSDGPPHDGKEIGTDLVTYTYDQPIPIPSYLIAIAVGNVLYEEFKTPEGKQWTSGIWAEPETIEAAYYEFSEDTTKFLAAEEELVTSYRFGVYDLLVLPPSFPYGGMENACLSFLTPTLLTGDRTLVDVVVHELTHSWFGNGVTHANPSHFWLNEGWTTYIERVLQEKLHSPAARGFAYVIGSKALYDSLKDYEDRPKFQRLVIAFEEGEDPDDAYSSIPYEKGANFILHLEETLGGLDVFLPYVKSYVEKFMGQSITTAEWKEHLYEYWRDADESKIAALDDVDWDGWLYGEGTELPVKMVYDLTLAEAAWSLAERWDQARDKSVKDLDFTEDDLKGFNSNQIVAFLEKLQSYDALPSPLIEHLGSLYQVSSTPNAEIRLRFYGVALLDPTSDAAKTFAVEAANWVVGKDGTGVIKGRMKFCRPVLRDVGKVDIEFARKEWIAARDQFHPIARKLIDKDLGITKA